MAPQQTVAAKKAPEDQAKGDFPPAETSIFNADVWTHISTEVDQDIITHTHAMFVSLGCLVRVTTHCNDGYVNVALAYVPGLTQPSDIRDPKTGELIGRRLGASR